MGSDRRFLQDQGGTADLHCFDTVGDRLGDEQERGPVRYEPQCEGIHVFRPVKAPDVGLRPDLYFLRFQKADGSRHSGDDDMAIGEAAIEKTAEFFFDVLGLPRTLTEVGIGEENLEVMSANCAPGLARAFVPLSKQDVLEIYRACL